MQFGFTDQLVRFLVTFGKYEEDNYFYEGSRHDPKEDPPRGYWVKDFRWARKKFEELVDVVAKDYAPIDCDKPRLESEPMPGLFRQKQLDENLKGIEGLWYCHFARGPTMMSVAIAARGVWNFQDFYEVVIVAQNPELAMDSRREGRPHTERARGGPGPGRDGRRGPDARGRQPAGGLTAAVAPSQTSSGLRARDERPPLRAARKLLPITRTTSFCWKRVDPRSGRGPGVSLGLNPRGA